MNTKSTALNIYTRKKFEEIRKIDKTGAEFWEARELMPLLDYARWENFENVVDKAKNACENSGQVIHNHFRDVTKMITIATGTERETVREGIDYQLSRYACYLIAQNGDSRKLQIAAAQTYFAIQTRKQELYDNLTEEEKRLFVRQDVRTSNKHLLDTAHKAGVTKYGKFNNAGYQGLYSNSVEDIKKKKGISDDILDRAGVTELAANLFRITQTDEKLQNESIQGQTNAENTHFEVGRKVRHTIKEIGGTMPEDLPTEEHIRKLEKKVKSDQFIKANSSKPLVIAESFETVLKKVSQIKPLQDKSEQLKLI